MKITVPDYYLKFKCIADKCSDSCCIGWEIDIDDVARNKYAVLNDELGTEIRAKTQHGVFPLQNNGRCAFLDECGLCRIISALGEGYLCDICREHPRYYGVGRDGLEGGLGLACPEAARIILSVKEKPSFVAVDANPSYESEDDFDEANHKLRALIYDVIYSHDALGVRSLFPSLAEYADNLAFAAVSGANEASKPDLTSDCEAISEDYIAWLISLFSECEALSEEWGVRLAKAKHISAKHLENSIVENADSYRALLFYFTHRYLRECIEDMSAKGRVLLARCSSDLIFLLATTYESSDALEKAAVLFSKNIEYSTENIEMLTDALADTI